jgi:hypothetical protein
MKPVAALAGAFTMEKGDERRLVWKCPKCGAAVTGQSRKCFTCSQPLDWTGDFTCPFCAEPGNGTCGVCKGEPLRGMFGMELPCPSCDNTRKCGKCKGTGKIQAQ